MKEVKCRISTVHQVSDDILFITIDPDKRFEVEDFNELKRAALKLGEGKPFYNIIKVGAFTLPTRKARELSCSVEGSYYKIADAFVINTLPQRLMYKLMTKLNNPIVPTACFDSIQKAENWLRQLKMEREVQTAC